MKNNSFNQIIKNGISLIALTLVMGACKYQDIGDAVIPTNWSIYPLQ